MRARTQVSAPSGKKAAQGGESAIQRSGAEALKTGGAPSQGQDKGLGPKVGDGRGLGRTGAGVGPG